METELESRLLRMNARAWGIAFGLMAGLGLFAATNILLLKGGEVVGPNLALLGVYLPGYSVTFLGSLIGFVYMFVIGYGLGRLIGEVYNRAAHLGR
ncbi:MAG: hypothetical protein WD079_01590 [Phycisphaeraceae bacterium]